MSLKLKKTALTVFLLLCGIILSVLSYFYSGELLSSSGATSRSSVISLKHFDHLFSPVVGNDKKMAIVHIYSEYPDYKYAIAPDEGFACVDDVARAIVMLASYRRLHHDGEILRKIRMLVEFILYMQNDNGYFNNFVWPDMAINTRYKTSRAEMNWWSFRALWSLEVAYGLFRSDTVLVNRIEKAIDRLVVRIKGDISVTDFNTRVVNGVEIPDWLPNGSAADQSAVAIIALLPYYNRTGDARIMEIIKALAIGIMQMQKGDATHYPYGMLLSWKNEWHGWGNSQAYALLLAGQQLDQVEYIQSALLEIDNFYPYLVKKGLAESIIIRGEAGHYAESGRKQFPQIAYGIRPMVFALSEAYKVTGNEKYSLQLTALKSWFSGNNIAEKFMYDSKTGRTYDAIISASQVNMNSGAESTIEALLVVQK